MFEIGRGRAGVAAAPYRCSSSPPDAKEARPRRIRGDLQRGPGARVRAPQHQGLACAARPGPVPGCGTGGAATPRSTFVSPEFSSLADPRHQPRTTTSAHPAPGVYGELREQPLDVDRPGDAAQAGDGVHELLWGDRVAAVCVEHAEEHVRVIKVVVHRGEPRPHVAVLQDALELFPVQHSVVVLVGGLEELSHLLDVRGEGALLLAYEDQIVVVGTLEGLLDEHAVDDSHHREAYGQFVHEAEHDEPLAHVLGEQPAGDRPVRQRHLECGEDGPGECAKILKHFSPLLLVVSVIVEVAEAQGFGYEERHEDLGEE
mmetsp:Transcript_23093/g.61732  ORF Transcript_23093/g.61732 Transcript_23093/m.61732 type:complete len:316 (+) Transcript_23093:94-1041(+)